MSNDNLETVRLTLELLRRIPRNRKVTARELREDVAKIGLVREPRTILRQLDFLCEHYGVVRDDARPAGYRRGEGSDGLVVAPMSEQEALLLMLALQHLAAFLPPSVMKALDAFFKEARRNLDPFGDSRLARQWLRKVRVISETVKLLPPKIAPGVFETVSQALYANRWLHVRYRDAFDKVSDKQVMPLALVHMGPCLYLVFRYEPTGTDRTLAVHRMLSAKAGTLGFEIPADFDLDRFVEEDRLGFGNGQRVRLSFRIARAAGNHYRETWLSTDQKIEVEGDWLRITATMHDSLKLKRLLLSFGDEVRDVVKEAVPAEEGAAAPQGTKGGAG